MAPQRYRADIDGLRAIAVISVLLFHLGFNAFSGGYVGVDVFFVISGFLITRLIRDEVLTTGAFSFSNFYARRARRLFPSLYFTLSLSLLFGYLLFSTQHLERFGGALVHTLLSISNIYFWRESGYFDTDALFKPLLHTWSLGVEEQFYVVWPLLLVFLLLKTPKSIPILLVLAGIFSLFMNYIFADGEVRVLAMVHPAVAQWFVNGPSTIFYLLPFRIFEFAIGGLLVWLVRFQPRKTLLLEPLVMIGLLMIVYSVFTFTKDTLFPHFNALIPCAGAALIIFGGGGAKYTSKVLNNRIAVGIGLVSYSLYLIHWPIIVFYKYYKFNELTWIEQIIIFVAVIMAAMLMYKFIEQPFRRGATSTKAWSRGGVGFACTILALFLVLPAANSWANAGWEWRVNTAEPSDYFAAKSSGRKSPKQIKEAEFSQWTIVRSHGSTANDRKKVLLIGDSHANQLFGLTDYLGAKYNLEFEIFWFPGCPPIFGTYKVYGAPKGIENPSAKQEACANQTARWEKYIEVNRFEYVILASRWAWLFESEDYGQYNIRRDLLIEKTDPKFTIDASRMTFLGQLEYTVRKIRESGAEPIVFGQVVNQGKALDGCDNVPKFLIGDSQIGARCASVSKELVLERLGWTNRAIQDIAQRMGFSAVIPTDYFCNTGGDFCRTFFQGIRLTSDEDHINKYGAIYLAKQWEQEESFPFHNIGVLANSKTSTATPSIVTSELANSSTNLTADKQVTTKSTAEIQEYALQFSESLHVALGSSSVGIWDFDEGSGISVIDSSGSESTGTINGGSYRCDDTPYHLVERGDGHCSLQIGGADDSVEILDNETLNITDAVTVSAWVKQTGDALNRSQRIVDKAGALTIWIQDPGGQVCVRLAGTKKDGNRSQVCFKANVQQGNWYHMAFSYNKDAQERLKLYVNGILVGTDNQYFGPLATNQSNLMIGNTKVGTRPFNGLIDEVRIYSQAVP